MKSYSQRFNAESLRVDIPNEKFATTAFIAGLGVHSKDLMFSISKNPQASMAEVLTQAEKYINGEEAFYLSEKTLLHRRRKAGERKSENEALGGEETGIDPHEGIERTDSDLQRNEATSGIAWAHLSPSCSSDIHFGNSPP